MICNDVDELYTHYDTDYDDGDDVLDCISNEIYTYLENNLQILHI